MLSQQNEMDVMTQWRSLSSFCNPSRGIERFLCTITSELLQSNMSSQQNEMDAINMSSQQNEMDAITSSPLLTARTISRQMQADMDYIYDVSILPPNHAQPGAEHVCHFVSWVPAITHVLAEVQFTYYSIVHGRRLESHTVHILL